MYHMPMSCAGTRADEQVTRGMLDGHDGVFAGGESAPVGEEVGEEVLLAFHLELAGNVQRDLASGIERSARRRGAGLRL